jgi:hypothetical protein
MFVAIALHYVKPEHWDDMLGYMREAAKTTEGWPRKIGFENCRELSRGVLAGYSRWESQEAFQSAFQKVVEKHAGQRDPDWCYQDDEVVMLEPM